MERGRAFGYLGITLFIIAGIILAVLGALGYLTPKSGGGPLVPGTPTTATFATLDNIKPMWGLCVSGSPKTFNGVEYHLQSACEDPSCQVIVKATYTYADGTTDVTSKTWGDSGLYHNPPTDATNIPDSAQLQVYTDSVSGTVLQNTYNVQIPSNC